MLIGQRIRPSMECSVRQHLFRQSDQSFRHQGLCFRPSLSPQCSPTERRNILGYQHEHPMFRPQWKWMLHIAGTPFQCSADDVGNLDTLRGNVRRVTSDKREGWIENLSGVDVATAEAQCPTLEPPVALLETSETS